MSHGFITAQLGYETLHEDRKGAHFPVTLYNELDHAGTASNVATPGRASDGRASSALARISSPAPIRC